MKKIKNKIKFAKRTSVLEIEEGKNLCPKFNKDKLLPCITTEYKSKEILMFSYINRLAFRKSLETKLAHYYSRSRKSIWFKGETSGMYHNIKNMFIDDDQDCVIFKVEVEGSGASCHVGYKSCFYRSVENLKDLEFVEEEKLFDPEEVYEGQENPTKL